DIDILRHTREDLDSTAFYQAVDALISARKVYVMGAGSSLALATFLAHYFRLIFDTVQLVEATSEASVFQQLVRAGEGDAILAISFPRYSKKAAKALKYASSRGMTAIAVTDSPQSPLAEGASHLLLAQSDMVSFVDSLVGPLSLLNALIVTVAIRKKAEVVETLRHIESIWDEYGVYEKVEEGEA
ncbi:MAG: MurR/RpiR family transcriptional regulator, partial [Acutalibacter sp.]|nr:MurR/RpiR family transcriptional regulator [Acutalibacter sp.]